MVDNGLVSSAPLSRPSHPTPRPPSMTVHAHRPLSPLARGLVYFSRSLAAPRVCRACVPWQKPWKEVCPYQMASYPLLRPPLRAVAPAQQQGGHVWPSPLLVYYCVEPHLTRFHLPSLPSLPLVFPSLPCLLHCPSHLRLLQNLNTTTTLPTLQQHDGHTQQARSEGGD